MPFVYKPKSIQSLHHPRTSNFHTPSLYIHCTKLFQGQVLGTKYQAFWDHSYSPKPTGIIQIVKPKMFTPPCPASLEILKGLWPKLSPYSCPPWCFLCGKAHTLGKRNKSHLSMALASIIIQSYLYKVRVGPRTSTNPEQPEKASKERLSSHS